VEYNHKRKKFVLNQFIGGKADDPDIFTIPLRRDNEIVLMCTDGLSNSLTDDFLKETLTSDYPIGHKADLLEAASRQVSEDDTSFIIYAHDGKKIGVRKPKPSSRKRAKPRA